MYEEFMCDEASLDAIIQEYKNAEQYMTSALQKAEILKTDLEDSVCWKGKSREALSGYIDILCQYHYMLCGGESDSVLNQATKAMEELYSHSTEFCELSDAYRKMEEL